MPQHHSSVVPYLPPGCMDIPLGLDVFARRCTRTARDTQILKLRGNGIQPCLPAHDHPGTRWKFTRGLRRVADCLRALVDGEEPLHEPKAAWRLDLVVAKNAPPERADPFTGSAKIDGFLYPVGLWQIVVIKKSNPLAPSLCNGALTRMSQPLALFQQIAQFDVGRPSFLIVANDVGGVIGAVVVDDHDLPRQTLSNLLLDEVVQHVGNAVLAVVGTYRDGDIEHE